jgi:hypothetical protein
MGDEKWMTMVAAQWQPVQTMPKDGSKILVAYSHGAVEILLWENDQWHQACDLGLIVTSRDQVGWMPLPEVPKAA